MWPLGALRGFPAPSGLPLFPPAFSTRPFQQNPALSTEQPLPTRSTPRPARQQSAPPRPLLAALIRPAGSAPFPAAKSSPNPAPPRSSFMWFPPDLRTLPPVVCGLSSATFEKPRRGPRFPLSRCLHGPHPAHQEPGPDTNDGGGILLSASPPSQELPQAWGQPLAGLVVLQTPRDQHLPRPPPSGRDSV